MKTTNNRTQLLEEPETATPKAFGAEVSSGRAGPRVGVLLIWTTCLLVLVVMAAVAGFIPRHRQRGALQAETRELSVPTVAVLLPTAGRTSVTPLLPAEVKPFVESPIYARASGFLKRWLVDIGGEMEAGQMPAPSDTPDLDQDLARARAEAKQSEAALTLAKTTAARWAELVKTASVSEQESAEKQSDLALKSATLDAAHAAVRRLEELKSFARLTAPFAGTITARHTDVGDLIRADGAKELFRLAQVRTLRVVVRVPQAAARGIKTGQPAELTIPELPGKVFAAKVVRTSGAMSPDSRTLLTELEVDNSKGEILAGSYAQARLTDLTPEDGLQVPSNTLLFLA